MRPRLEARLTASAQIQQPGSQSAWSVQPTRRSCRCNSRKDCELNLLGWGILSDAHSGQPASVPLGFFFRGFGTEPVRLLTIVGCQGAVLLRRVWASAICLLGSFWLKVLDVVCDWSAIDEPASIASESRSRPL